MEVDDTEQILQTRTRIALSAQPLRVVATDKAKIAAYAEAYNGTGYNSQGVPSPYPYSGTDDYSTGKYIHDGVYSAGTVDQQTGVIPLVNSVSP